MENKIFISYCWEDKKKVDELDNIFKNEFGIIITRDERDFNYKENLNSFMERIRDHKFFILFLSDHYFKSYNCLKELENALKDQNFRNKMLPICSTNEIFDYNYCNFILDYWDGEEKRLDEIYKKSDYYSNLPLAKKILNIKIFRLKVSEFLETFKENKLVSFEEEKKINFSSLINEIKKHDIIKKEEDIKFISPQETKIVINEENNTEKQIDLSNKTFISIEEYILFLLEKETLSLNKAEKVTIKIALQKTRWNKQETAKILGIGRTTLYEKINKYKINETLEDEKSENNILENKVFSLNEVEKIVIEKTLQKTRWNKQETAKILEIGRTTLYEKINKYKIDTSNF